MPIFPLNGLDWGPWPIRNTGQTAIMKAVIRMEHAR